MSLGKSSSSETLSTRHKILYGPICEGLRFLFLSNLMITFVGEIFIVNLIINIIIKIPSSNIDLRLFLTYSHFQPFSNKLNFFRSLMKQLGVYQNNLTNLLTYSISTPPRTNIFIRINTKT